MSKLAQFLHDVGYARLQLQRSAVGHFHINGDVNGRAVRVLVDTGASVTVLSMNVVHELGLTHQRFHVDAGGAGGAIEQFVVDDAALRIDGFSLAVSRVAGMDFEHVNASLLAAGSEPVDIILGADVFDLHGAVIDFSTRSLFLLTHPHDA